MSGTTLLRLTLLTTMAGGGLSMQGCGRPEARRAPSSAPAPPASAQAQERQWPAEIPGASPEDRLGWALRDERAAIAAALGFFGLPADDARQVSARIVTVTEDNTPFLHGQIEGRPIWRVTLDDFRLHLKSDPPGEGAQRSLTYDILLDPRNGKLLKIVSRWPAGMPEMLPEPRAAFAEWEFGNNGSEMYHAFPDAPPRVSLLDALDTIRDWGSGDPLVANQIVAQYVVRSYVGREPVAVWAVNLRGIPPMGPHGPEAFVSAWDHMRHIVDAKTGRWLGAGTSPQPERPPGPETEEERRFRIALEKVRRAQAEKRQREQKP